MDLSSFFPPDRDPCSYGVDCYRMNPNHLRWKKHQHLESAVAQSFRSPDVGGQTHPGGAARSSPNLSDQVQVLQEEIAVQESLIQMFQKQDQGASGASSGHSQAATAAQEQPRPTANCVVCMDPKSVRNGLILPCAHLQTCLDCARTIRRQPNGGHCPVCRGPINSVMKVFV